MAKNGSNTTLLLDVCPLTVAHKLEVVNQLVNKWTMQANILVVTYIAHQAGWQAGSHTHFTSYMALRRGH